MASTQKTHWFLRFAKWGSNMAGRPVTFALAVLIILIWAVTGPVFGYSDTWQLVINTSTTIITFLMVFLIQNSQNRDTEALQIKIDELIRVQQAASNSLLDLENRSEEDLKQAHEEFIKLAEEERKNVEGG